MADKRKHVRTRITLKVKITHPLIGTVTFLTRDLSDNGMFVIIKGSPPPPVGEIVDAQILDVVDQPPVCRMRVVRLNNEGVGLVLCEDKNQAAGS